MFFLSSMLKLFFILVENTRLREIKYIDGITFHYQLLRYFNVTRKSSQKIELTMPSTWRVNNCSFTTLPMNYLNRC